jgi:hypothetical protein
VIRAAALGFALGAAVAVAACVGVILLDAQMPPEVAE